MQSGRFELGETEQSEVSIQFESGRSHFCGASSIASAASANGFEAVSKPIDAEGTSRRPPFEILLSRIGIGAHASRLSSDWESTRLKIELSPVQIGEAAFSCD